MERGGLNRSTSLSNGLLLANSPEQKVGTKRARSRSHSTRPGHRRIHSEPVHVAAP